MTTFAHTETGVALEPQENKAKGDYLARFPGVDTSKWDVEQVTDGTVQGAKPDGQGGWVNPIQPASPPPPTPTVISSSDLTAWLQVINGNLISIGTKIGVAVNPLPPITGK